MFWAASGSVCKITPTGELYTVGVFHSPGMLGFDADGNLYVRDWLSETENVLSKIPPCGVVSIASALPAGFGADSDGKSYSIQARRTIAVSGPDKVSKIVAGSPDIDEIILGALPGGFRYINDFTRTGPKSFAVTSGNSVLKLVVP